MDILDMFWTFLLKPPQPCIGLFLHYNLEHGLAIVTESF